MKNMMSTLKEVMEEFSVYYIYDGEKRLAAPLMTKLSATESSCKFTLTTTYSNKVKNEKWNKEEFIKGDGIINVNTTKGNVVIDITFTTNRFNDTACEIKASGTSAADAYRNFNIAINAYKEYYDTRNEMYNSK